MSADIIGSKAFVTAVKETVAVELNVSSKSVIVSISLVTGRRNLLSNALLTYTVPVSGQGSANALKEKLGSAMETGSFFRTLEAKSGVAVSPASSLSIALEEETAAPSSSLFTQSAVSSGKCITHTTLHTTYVLVDKYTAFSKNIDLDC